MDNQTWVVTVHFPIATINTKLSFQRLLFKDPEHFKSWLHALEINHNTSKTFWHRCILVCSDLIHHEGCTSPTTTYTLLLSPHLQTVMEYSTKSHQTTNIFSDGGSWDKIWKKMGVCGPMRISLVVLDMKKRTTTIFVSVAQFARH